MAAEHLVAGGRFERPMAKAYETLLVTRPFPQLIFKKHLVAGAGFEPAISGL